MGRVMLIGIILLALGGVLMAIGHFSYQDTDPVVEIGSLEITKTETKQRRIPVAVSGSILGVGAVLTVVGAMKKK